MVEHPIVQNDKVGEEIKIREDHPEKFLGAPSFTFKSHKNEKERVLVRSVGGRYLGNNWPFGGINL